MPKLVHLIKSANNIDEAIIYIKSYFPIRKNGTWCPTQIVVYQNTFDNTKDAFEFLEQNFINNTINICEVNKNRYAYIYQI